jgi:hypothetical protein
MLSVAIRDRMHACTLHYYASYVQVINGLTEVCWTAVERLRYDCELEIGSAQIVVLLRTWSVLLQFKSISVVLGVNVTYSYTVLSPAAHCCRRDTFEQFMSNRIFFFLALQPADRFAANIARDRGCPQAATPPNQRLA